MKSLEFSKLKLWCFLATKIPRHEACRVALLMMTLPSAIGLSCWLASIMLSLLIVPMIIIILALKKLLKVSIVRFPSPLAIGSDIHSSWGTICQLVSNHVNLFPLGTVQKLLRLSGNFPDCPENFQTVWKLYRP